MDTKQLKPQEALDDLAALLDLSIKSGYTTPASLFVLQEIVRRFNPVYVMELGTYHGCSAVFIARALNQRATLVTIDDYRSTTINDVAETLGKFGVANKVTLVNDDTTMCGDHARELIDMAYFDASHTDEGVLAEYESIKPHLASPALLVFDDALCIPTAIAEIGRGNRAMRAYGVHFGVCAMVKL